MTEAEEKNLFSRLKRRLRREGLILHKNRVNSRHYYMLGDYYLTDARRNCMAIIEWDIDDRDLDLEELAKEWLS